MSNESKIAQQLCNKLIAAGLSEELAITAIMYRAVNLYRFDNEFIISDLSNKPFDMVYGYFVWEDTPEGVTFWRNICKGLK